MKKQTNEKLKGVILFVFAFFSASFLLYTINKLLEILPMGSVQMPITIPYLILALIFFWLTVCYMLKYIVDVVHSISKKKNKNEKQKSV